MHNIYLIHNGVVLSKNGTRKRDAGLMNKSLFRKSKAK